MAARISGDPSPSLSRNMCKGPMDKAKGGVGLRMGGGGLGEGGDQWEGMEKTILESQLKKLKKEYLGAESL